MSLFIPAGFGSCAWEITSADGTSPFITTLGVEVDPVEDPADVANKLFDAYATTLLAQTGNTFSLDRVILTIPVGDGTVGTVESNLVPDAGSLSGERCSLSMAMLVNKRTSGIGRTSRGRMFLPGIIPQGAVDSSGLMLTATVTAYQIVVDNFLDALNGTGGAFPIATPPVLLHSDEVRAPTPINALTVSQKVGSLRRRIR